MLRGMSFPRLAILLAPSLMLGSLACTVNRTEPASPTVTMPPPAEIAPAPAPPPPVAATPAAPMPPPVAATPATPAHPVPPSTPVTGAGSSTAPSSPTGVKVGTAGSTTTPSPSTGTKVGIGGSVCAVDTDCKMVTEMCNSCSCNAVLKDATTPKCAGGKSVQCFADPCMKKKAACRSGMCAIVDSSPAM